jgi:hypothetical protein
VQGRLRCPQSEGGCGIGAVHGGGCREIRICAPAVAAGERNASGGWRAAGSVSSCPPLWGLGLSVTWRRGFPCWHGGSVQLSFDPNWTVWICGTRNGTAECNPKVSLKGN